MITKTRLQHIIEAYYIGGVETLKAMAPETTSDTKEAAQVLRLIANVLDSLPATTQPARRSPVSATDDINIGDGATLHVGSDCYPLTVVAKTKRSVRLQRDEFTAAEGHNYYGEQKYTYTPNPNGAQVIARMTKRGWRSGGSPVSFAGRRAYQDPSF
jgi:hypothetical protein